MSQLAKIFTRASTGLDAPVVTIEVHISGGLPGFSIVGLPEGALKESKDRVRSALINSQFKFPKGRLEKNCRRCCEKWIREMIIFLI